MRGIGFDCACENLRPFEDNAGEVVNDGKKWRIMVHGLETSNRLMAG